MNLESRRRIRGKALAFLLIVVIPIMALATAGAIYLVNDAVEIAQGRAEKAENQAAQVERRLTALEQKSAEADRRSQEQRDSTESIARQNRKALCVAIRGLVAGTDDVRSAGALVRLAKDLDCVPPVPMPDFPKAAPAAADTNRPAPKAATPAPRVVPRSTPGPRQAPPGPVAPAPKPPTVKRPAPKPALPPAPKPAPKPPTVTVPKVDVPALPGKPLPLQVPLHAPAKGRR